MRTHWTLSLARHGVFSKVDHPGRQQEPEELCGLTEGYLSISVGENTHELRGTLENREIGKEQQEYKREGDTHREKEVGGGLERSLKRGICELSLLKAAGGMCQHSLG